MAAPILSALGERLRERTEPLQPPAVDERNGYVHAHLCEALMRMLGEVGAVWDPEDPADPHAPLLDPALAPDWALPWVAQLVGVTLPDTATPEQQRALITDAPSWRRGTPAALVAACQLTLTGNRTVALRERDGSAYRIEVLTLTDETPDPAQTLAVLLRQKPGGLVLAHRVVDRWDYQLMTTAGGTYAALAVTYDTYQNLTDHEAA